MCVGVESRAVENTSRSHEMMRYSFQMSAPRPLGTFFLLRLLHLQSLMVQTKRLDLDDLRQWHYPFSS